MKKRQFEKILYVISAKLALKIKYPELAISSTKAERKVVRRNKGLVSSVVKKVLIEEGKRKGDAK